MTPMTIGGVRFIPWRAENQAEYFFGDDSPQDLEIFVVFFSRRDAFGIKKTTGKKHQVFTE
ncbi:MAG: hypothetical protein V3U24_00365 [Candidatus Neomarinimicrobiota bacterium]